MGSQYERELRQVLAGIPKGVEAVIRSCNEQEKMKMRLIIQRPFLVVRAAGSGMEGSGDLLALRGDLCFPIEVKSSKKSKFYLSGRTKEQYESMIYEGERCNLMPLYAYRLKGIRGDSWRIFRVETESLSGKLRKLSPLIPAFPKTRGGKPFMDWEQGMKLNDFIALVSSQAGVKQFNLNQLKIRSSQNKTKFPSKSEEKLGFQEKNKPSKQVDIFAELARRKSV
ncbi:MAG: Holliday junction resolvase [Euryarchaeota archaeon]|nr:Holliday junction resolvase [Euryarchaeota archaeon]